MGGVGAQLLGQFGKEGQGLFAGRPFFLSPEDPVVHLPEEDDILFRHTVGGDGRGQSVGMYGGEGHIAEDEFHGAALAKCGQEGRFGLDHVTGAERAFVVAVFVDGDRRVRIAAEGVSLFGKADRDSSMQVGLRVAGWRRGNDGGDDIAVGIGRTSCDN